MGDAACLKLLLCSGSNAQSATNLGALAQSSLEGYIKISPELVAQAIEAQDKQEKKNAELALRILREAGFGG